MKLRVTTLLACLLLPLGAAHTVAAAPTVGVQSPVVQLPMPASFGPLTLPAGSRHTFDVDRTGGGDWATLTLSAKRGQMLSGTLTIVDPDTGVMRRQFLLDGQTELVFKNNPTPVGGRDRYVLQAGSWPMTLNFSLVDRFPVMRNGRAYRPAARNKPYMAMIRPDAGPASVATWGGNGGATLRVYEWRAGKASRLVCQSVGDSWRQCDIDATGQIPYLVSVESDVPDLKLLARW